MPKAIRITAIILLALGLLLGVLAISGLGRQQTQPQAATAQPPAASSQPKRAVVVATAALQAGQPILASDLSNADLAVAPGEGFSSISDVVGRVPTHTIAAGAMVSPAQLAQGLAVGLLPGERALAVPVDELAGVSNRVQPGDFVDVFMSLQDPDGSSGRANPQARLLLSRLRVLGYGDNDVTKQAPATVREDDNADAVQPAPGSRAETIAARESGSTNSNSNGVQARSAILAVPVQDAGRLLLAAHSGKLFLALRNPGDTALADSSIFVEPPPVLSLRRGLDSEMSEAATRPENQAYAGISLSALAGDGQAKAATGSTTAPARSHAPRPAARRGIEIIRGATPSNRLSSP